MDGTGLVSSCGLASWGQLGHGDGENVGVPRAVAALASIVVVQVAAGLYHSMALAADGGVWSWGSGELGRLGHGGIDDRVRTMCTCLPHAAVLSQPASSLCSLLLL